MSATGQEISAARRAVQAAHEKKPAYMYVIYVPATATEQAQIFGDDKGRPYRKLAVAEDAARAISSTACVKPLERW